MLFKQKGTGQDCTLPYGQPNRKQKGGGGAESNYYLLAD